MKESTDRWVGKMSIGCLLCFKGEERWRGGIERDWLEGSYWQELITLFLRVLLI